MSIRSTVQRWLSRPDNRLSPSQDGPWSQACLAIDAKLAHLGTHTEDDFLALGNDLQAYYTRAQTMASLSQVVVQLMTGEDAQTAKDDLHATLQELHTYLEDSSTQFSRMGAMFQQYLHELSTITAGLESFQMLSLNLSILGFLTRVENAHLVNTNSGFSALTDDVRKLSESIKDKASSIRTTCENISASVARALDKVTNSDRTHNATARTIHAQAVASERLLAEKYGRAVEAAQAIDQNIAQIASDISAIVMSLQFHDITRQQIQHVQTVLEHLHTRLQGPTTTSDRQAAVLGDTLELQEAQIAQSRQEFVTAVNTVRENMQAIADNVTEIISEIDQVAWATDKEGVSTMNSIKHGFEAIIDHIMVTAELQADLNTAAHNVSGMVAQMSTFVQDIHTLGLNLEFLALNARIKAAHLGKEGVALDTISGSIYELSHSTRADTSALADILKRLSDHSQGFTQDLKARDDRQAQIMQSLMDKLAHLTGILSDISDRVQIKTTEISELGAAMIHGIHATLAAINVHERVAFVLDDAEELMRQTEQDARRMCPQGWQGAAIDFLQEIDQLYTMHSERRVHALHLDKEAKPATEAEKDTTNVEFF